MKIIDFYTIISKEDNRYSQWEKKIKLFHKIWKDRYSFLPSQPYVFPTSEERVKPELRYCQYPNYKWKLSDEQEYILDIVKRRFNEYSYWAWLVNMKTGRWKSHVIMAITDFFHTKTIILCHNIKTLNEMAEKFKEYLWYEPGIIWWWKNTVKDITLCTHSSFPDIWSTLDVDLILYDECDFSLSKAMIEWLCKSSAKLLYWLTWTPYRQDMDNNDLQKVFGKQIEYTNVEHNIIPDIAVIKYRSDSFKSYEYENWAEEKECLVQDKHRMMRQVELVADIIRERHLILVLTERVEEAENIYKYLSYSCQFETILITWKTKVKDDIVNINKVRNGGVIVWTIWKMARWVDIPEIDTVCLFASIHFQGTVVQAVWRALRHHPGKDNVLLVDWSDIPILYQQHYQRRKAYQKEYGLTDKDIKQYDELSASTIKWNNHKGSTVPTEAD